MENLEAESIDMKEECVLLLPYTRTKKDIFLNNEMRLLIDSASYKAVLQYEFRSKNPSKPFTSALLQEVKFAMENITDPLVIVGIHLSAKQHIDLEKFLECAVLDKFELVLEIFALRAMTEEAKVQIRLAQLKYESPRERLRLMDKLSLEGAWQTERMGFGGTGENPLNIFDANVKKREAHLRGKLETLKQQRIESRLTRKRYHHDSVYISIVGYTSAGKSTLLNSLVGTNSASVNPRLFETLDTRIRSFKLDDLKIFVTDTVGFIEDLPTFLIDSFRSTLEESVASDIILVLIDGSESSDLILQKLDVTLSTLNEVTPQNNRVLVINKIDTLEPKEINSREDLIQKHYPEYKSISVSAIGNIQPIIDIIADYRPKRRYHLSYTPDYNFRSFCYEFTKVESEEFGDNWEMVFSIRKPTYGLDFLEQKAKTLNVKIELKAVG
ncbi:MAG: GTPase HflX [Candidatus Hodarchaeales archaeon]